MTQRVVTGEELKQTALGRELDDEQCHQLAAICGRQTVVNGKPLFKEGDPSGGTLFVIISGRFAVSRETDRGFSDTLTLLDPGDLAGESGFIDGSQHSATLRAVGDAEVATLSREQLESMLVEQPVLVYQVMRAVVRAIRQIIRRMNQQHSELLGYINTIGRY